MKSSLLIVFFLAFGIAEAQDAITPRPGLPVSPGSPEDQPVSPLLETSQVDPLAGYLHLKEAALAKWKSAQIKINAEIDQACNPNRIRYLVAQLMEQRTPYDTANRKYWEQWRKLAELGLPGIAADEDDKSQLEDFKKDLDHQQSDLKVKRAERDEAAAKLRKSRSAQAAAKRKDKASFDVAIAALQDLVAAIDDLIRQKEGAIEQSKALIEAAQNKKNGREYVARTWKYLLETADEYVKSAEMEAKLAKERAELYAQNRLKACVQASAPAGVSKPQ